MDKKLFDFSVKLADLDIRVETKYRYTPELFSDYICQEVSSPDIFLEFSEKDLVAECANDPKYPEWYHESLCVHRKLCTKIIDFDAMLIHSSAIALDGEAYLFTAPSGTGKSTHTRLWREHFGERAVMVNDDKPIVREKDGRFFVYGTPYNGQHHLGANIFAPVRAICIVTRARENSIERITAKDAIAPLLNQTLMPADEKLMDKLLATFKKLLDNIPVYRLKCNISDEAVEVAYEGMKN